MEAKENGIALTNDELRALREFGSKDKTNRDMFTVEFEVAGDRVFARASDSRRCVIFEGMSDGSLGNNTWIVDMKFLIDGRKELEGKEVLRLNFKGASLRCATVEENGLERLTIERLQDAAVAQASLPKLVKDAKIPGPRRERPHCITLASGHLKAVELAAKAVKDEMIDWFPPAEADGLLVFRVAHDKETSAIGGILLNLSAESILRPGDSEDDDEDEDKPRRRKGRNGRQQDLPTGDEAH